MDPGVTMQHAPHVIKIKRFKLGHCLAQVFGTIAEAIDATDDLVWEAPDNVDVSAICTEMVTLGNLKYTTDQDMLQDDCPDN